MEKRKKGGNSSIAFKYKMLLSDLKILTDVVMLYFPFTQGLLLRKYIIIWGASNCSQ
jgi:hypothetical protein